MRNCEKCGFSYEPYNPKGWGSMVCQMPCQGEKKGLCPFCNPKSEQYSQPNKYL